MKTVLLFFALVAVGFSQAPQYMPTPNPGDPIRLTRPAQTGSGAPSNPCPAAGATYIDTTGLVFYVCPSAGGNWFDASTGVPSTAVAPYTVSETTQTSVSITAATHGQGTLAVAYCFDNSTPTVASACSYTRDTSGNLVFTFSPAFTGVIEIGSGGGTAFNATGAVVYSAGPPATTTLRDFPSVRDSAYGAVPDRVYLTDATMTASSAALTTAHTFTSADVGKTCVIGGSGTTTGGFAYNLVTTIASVAAGAATLTASAGTTTLTPIATTATAVAGTTVITVASAMGIIPGLAATGGGIPTGTFVELVSGTSITLSLETASALSATPITFSQPSACGTDNFSAFAAAVAGTNGTGFYIPQGSYLVSNASNNGLGLSTGWTGQVIFATGAELVGTIATASTGFSVIALSGTKNTRLINPWVSFAGNPLIPKGNNVANGISVLNTTNTFIDSPLIMNAPSSCIVESLNTNALFINVNINNCGVNGFYSASSQATTLTGMTAINTGDYALEVDTKTSVGGGTQTGFTASGIKVRYSWGAVLLDSKLEASITDIQGEYLCDGGLKILHTVGPNPTGINVGKAWFNHVGGFADSRWTSCTSTGAGTALVVNGAADAHIGSFTALNTSGTTFQLLNNTAVEVSQVFLSQSTGPQTVQGNTYAKIGTFHSDHSSTQFLLSTNTQLLGNQWDFLDMCTAATCSGVGVQFTGNGQFNVSGNIVLNDDQVTPSGYNVASGTTTNTSTINSIQGIITHGTLGKTLDANTVLDALSLGVAPSSIGQIGSAPTNPCTSGAVETRTDTGTLYNCVHGLWIGNDSTSIQLTEDFTSGAFGTSGQIGALGWVFSNIGAAPTCTLSGLVGFPHPGVLNCASTTTSGQGGTLWMGSSGQPGNVGAIGNSAPWWSEWIAGISPVTNVAWRIGFGTSATTATIPTNGIYFRFDTSLGTPDTNIMACVDTTSSETCTSTGQAPANNTFYDLYISSATAQKIIFQVGANAAVSICPSSCTATATPPSAALGPMMNIATETTSSASMFADYFQYLSSVLSR